MRISFLSELPSCVKAVSLRPGAQAVLWQVQSRVHHCSPSIAFLQRQPGKCAVVLRAEELASYGFNVSTQVTLDARIVTQAAVRLRNISGAADHHNFMLQYGGHSRHDLGKEVAYKLRFPRIYGRPWHSQLTLQQSNNDCRRESSYNEILRGANFDLLSCASLIARAHPPPGLPHASNSCAG